MIGAENPLILLLLVALIPVVLKVRDLERPRIAATGLLTLMLLILSASGLYMEEKSSTESGSLLVDSSDSMRLASENLSEYSPDRFSTAEGLRDLLEQGGDPFYVYSDFQIDTSGLSDAVPGNTTVNAVRPELSGDASVFVEGPETVVEDGSATFRVENRGNRGGSVRFYRDGELVEEGRPPFEETLEFNGSGFTRLKAVYTGSDSISENNRYFKSIRIREKPRIYSQEEIEGLSEFYRVRTGEFPENLSEFDALILSSRPERDVSGFLAGGGGVIFTGEEPPEWAPLRESSEERSSPNPAVALAIDVSAGTTESGAARNGKRVAADIVSALPGSTKVSLVAYSRYGNVVSQPVLLQGNREKIVDKISRLKTQGTSFHNRGLEAGKTSLMGSKNGNIVLITDGKIPGLAETRSVGSKTREEARKTRYRVITVGVGDNMSTSVSESSKKFLKDVAETGNGFYIDAAETNNFTLNLKGGGGSKLSALRIYNSNHFITENYNPTARIKEPDQYRTPETAQKLAGSSSGAPILTAWRVGLGRSAAVTVEGGLKKLKNLEPGLTGRTVAWAAGGEYFERYVEGERTGDSFRYVSRQEEQGLRKTGNGYWVEELEPNGTGIYTAKGLQYDANYREEIQELGFNDEKAAEASINGRIVNEVPDDLSEGSESGSRASLTPYLLAASLASYLLFVWLRKRQGLS